MWAIFLLSAMTVAVVALVILYIGNKVFIAMENDREKRELDARIKHGWVEVQGAAAVVTAD